MSRTTKTSLVFLGLFILGTVYLSTRVAQVECEVCVTFRGMTTCRKAASGTREAAIQSAVTSACSKADLCATALLRSWMFSTPRCPMSLAPPSRMFSTPVVGVRPPVDYEVTAA
jgi:hypothetical protein